MAVVGRSPAFTFESSVHPSQILRSLEDQRQRDVLCDVTVFVAEGPSFRAHRSVLASCSEYFSLRLSSLSGQNAVVTLPPEVTAAGFEPLLKFAYTSKLVYSKENVLDIKTSVSVLGFKDCDRACFDFILPKFFPSTKACVPRRTCCKKKYKKSVSRDTVDSGERLLPDDKEAKLVVDSAQQEVAFEFNNNDDSTPLMRVSPAFPLPRATSVTPSPPVTPTNDNGMYISKYRKFQMACGIENRKSKQNPLDKFNCNSPCSSNSERCPLRVPRPVEDLFDNTFGTFHHVAANKAGKALEKSQEVETQKENSRTTCNAERNAKSKSDGLVYDGLVLPEARGVNGSSGQDKAAANDSFAKTGCVDAGEEFMEEEDVGLPEEVPNCNGRWTFEDGKTANTSLDSLGVRLKLRSSLLPDVDQSASGWNCPRSSDCEGASQSGLSSLNSGEDSDAEYCNTYVQERAKQVQLPYPVNQLLVMSKNDFQELLDKQNLTQEQVELVRDMRRRSKNRLAAQRCRKRKLDCIYNLQCEINKLKTEREKLIQEKSFLNQLRMKTCRSVSTLCQRVCVDANLPPEQQQLLSKYTSAECPLASYVPIIDSLLSSQPRSPLVEDKRT
ncbi:transcription regulator protein BACH1b [Eucyclogobius newberryi]|uniref:transcription regulator protein BACH1b n=1 Tax=Eucyclogobius newberryi TaxID=166745 RepID=UPI003B59D911